MWAAAEISWDMDSQLFGHFSSAPPSASLFTLRQPILNRRPASFQAARPRLQPLLPRESCASTLRWSRLSTLGASQRPKRETSRVEPRTAPPPPPKGDVDYLEALAYPIRHANQILAAEVALDAERVGVVLDSPNQGSRPWFWAMTALSFTPGNSFSSGNVI